MKNIEEWKQYWDGKKGANLIALNDYCVDGIPLDWELYYEAVVKPNVERLEINIESEVLEIGCGTGLHLREMEGRVRRLVGTDISSTMLSHYKGTAETYVCPADRQPFKPESFNRILMVGVTMYFPDFGHFRRVIEQCIHLLRDGGILLIGDILFDNMSSRSEYLTYSKTDVVEYLDLFGYPFSLVVQNRKKRNINDRQDIIIYKERSRFVREREKR